MPAVLSVMTGIGFTQAVRLYAEASRTALSFPEMARAMTPLDGILVPTFGATYLVLILLFPALAVRSVAGEKEGGSLKLLLQLPLSTASIVFVKAAALSLGVLAALAPGLCAILAWGMLGGHVYLPETLNLVLGHCLHAFAIAGLSFLAAALTESVSAAVMAALACTLGSWVLDFTAASEGALRGLSCLSMTAALKPFERGIFSLEAVLQFLAVGGGGLALTAILLSRRPARRKALSAALAFLTAAGLCAVGRPLHVSRDLSEDRRNSFNPTVERALRRMDHPLTVTVHLSAEDSRLADLERNILDKLRRVLPRLSVVYAGASRDDYGLIVYEYAGERGQSRSNSEEEILPILFALAGTKVAAEPVPDYPGHPLAADAGAWGALFYLLLPLGAFFMAKWEAA